MREWTEGERERGREGKRGRRCLPEGVRWRSEFVRSDSEGMKSRCSGGREGG